MTGRAAPAAFDLTGRGVGLSGGGGHLGAAMALALAGAGATVVAFGRSAERVQAVARRAAGEGLPGRVVAEVADASLDEDLARVLDRVEAEAGAVHAWVNNAYAGQRAGLLELTRDHLEAVLGRGLADVMMATRLAAERMLPLGSGSIVNVASMYGLVSPQPAVYERFPGLHNPPAYGAAKAGVIQFTRYAACHLGGQGVRVNCISPGPFPGPGASGDPAFAAELATRVPLGRVGAPEDLGGAVTFLVSDASSFVTGHNLVVDGGWTAW